MLQKTMKQLLTKKITNWLETIDNEEVKKAIEKDLIITGGAITSMIENESPNDYDCYFKTKETTLMVANYYADKWNETHDKIENNAGYKAGVMVLDGANPSKEILDYYNINSLKESKAVMISNTPPERIKMVFPSDGLVGDPKEVRADEELGVDNDEIEEVTNTPPDEQVGGLDEIPFDEVEKLNDEQSKQEKNPYRPVFISSNAITLSDGIQIIVRFYGKPEEIHETYDYEHTKAYFDYNENQLVIPNRVYELVTNKTLIYSGSKYPVCSLFRMRKFINRGWKINAGQIVKMAVQVSELDLNNINVLEDQLIGVDSLYFMNLIKQFRKKKSEDPEWNLTTDYLISIIDKIF